MSVKSRQRMKGAKSRLCGRMFSPSTDEQEDEEGEQRAEDRALLDDADTHHWQQLIEAPFKMQ